MNGRRVRAVFRRHWYASIQSPPRLIDMFFWPVLDVLMWGVITVYLQRSHAELSAPIAFLLGGVLLWDLVFRSKNGIAIAVLSEGYTQNVINVLASPLTATEYLAGVLVFALSRAAVSWVLIVALAQVLFAFGVLSIGPAVAAYVGLLLLFGIALALVVVGLVLRFGSSVDELAWAVSGIVVPFAAVFYPVAVLPEWARAIAWAMPPAWVFESMRAALAGHPGAAPSLLGPLLLDVVYLAVGAAFARAMLGTFRRRGFVTRYM